MTYMKGEDSFECDGQSFVRPSKAMRITHALL